MAHHRILENILKEQQPQRGLAIDNRRLQPADFKQVSTQKKHRPRQCFSDIIFSELRRE
jgi:hypothetical protein